MTDGWTVLLTRIRIGESNTSVSRESLGPRVVFWYFAYGSNMALRSLRAKGVERGLLRGWRFRFNVQHFFRHEGRVGNIEPSNDLSDKVWGVLHLCEDRHLAHLDPGSRGCSLAA